MKFATIGLLAAATAVYAVPRVSKRADAPTDLDILNYALTLEYLENAFYTEALGKYDAAAFTAVDVDRTRFEEIASHEAQHVAFLAAALGSNATAACSYSFPYTDVSSFIALASIIEGVGVSAYLGAAAFITTPAYLTAAGSILTTESRHQAFLGHITGSAPWSGPEDTPLSLDDVYSLVAPFITSCPSTNPTLPVKAFPTLNVTSTNNTAGSTLAASFNSTGANSSATLYAAFLSGLNTTFVELDNNSAKIPDFNGTVYVVITSSNDTVSDDNTVAGPAILSLGGLPAANPAGLIKGASTSGSSGSNAAASSGAAASAGASGYSAASKLSLNLVAIGGLAAAACTLLI